MNHYGQMAMDHSRRHRPLAFAAIADPIRHFADLGEQVQRAITATRDEILGRQLEDETLDEYRTRGHQALRTAEEIVLADLVLLPAEATVTDWEQDERLADHYRRLQEISEATNRDW